MSTDQDKEPFSIKETTISNKRINLDGANFENVAFENCILVYHGGIFPEITNCQLKDCGWELGGAAHRTALYLKNLVGFGDADNIAALLGLTDHLSREKESRDEG